MSTEDVDTLTPGDEEFLKTLSRSVAGETLAASAADVVALGRRTRNRHRALAAGIGTGAVAVVAAIGVMVPSSGTGSGSSSGDGAKFGAAPKAAPRIGVPNSEPAPAGGPKPANPKGGTHLPMLPATGFLLAHQSDGGIRLDVKTLTDPPALQKALDQAGVPAAVVVQQIPDGWDMTHGIQCTPDPGVHPAGRVGGQVLAMTHGFAGGEIVIHPSAIPAGDFVTLTQFQSHGEMKTTNFGLYVGRQTTCVPQHPASSTGHDFG